MSCYMFFPPGEDVRIFVDQSKPWLVGVRCKLRVLLVFFSEFFS